MLDGDECDTLLTEAECEAAATMAGKAFGTPELRTDRPNGCWMINSGVKFKFNPSTAPCNGTADVFETGSGSPYAR